MGDCGRMKESSCNARVYLTWFTRDLGVDRISRTYDNR